MKPKSATGIALAAAVGSNANNLRTSSWVRSCKQHWSELSCGIGGIEAALEAAMALGPTSRALQDQGPEMRAAVATSIRRALQPYQRGEQVTLAGAIWLVTANNA
jgi:hypothetical protein